MARISTSRALDMRSFDVWYGVLSSYDSTHITIKAGLYSGTYRGHFSYDYYGDIYGQLDSYTFSYGGKALLTITDLHADANVAMNYIDYEDSGIYEYILQRADVFDLSDAADYITSFSGNDLIRGNGGNDTLDAGAGNDTIHGGSGADVLYGGGGADQMAGGTGNDVYFVDNLGDRVVELAGQGVDYVGSTVNWTLAGNTEHLLLLDRADLTGADLTGTGNALANGIEGNAGRNRLAGLAGNDTLSGMAGHDSLLGGQGNDILLGGAGNDRLAGGLGADRLTGGNGADVFVFAGIAETTTGGPGRDTITDFQRGQGDRIDLSAIDANAALAGNQAFQLRDNGAFTGHAGELVQRTSAEGTLILGDVNGDGRADFALLLDDRLTLGADSFLL